MGKPKALLDFDGKTALRLVVEAAAAAGVETSIVVAGHRAAEVMEAHRLEDLPGARRWAINPDEESEQLASLQIGLAELGEGACDWFLIHPVDYPLAAAADYRLLLAAAREESGAGKQERPPAATVLFLSHARRRGHPVLCQASLAAALLALPPGSTAREVLAREPCTHVITPNPGAVEDMDTPADYERLLRLHRERLPPRG